MRRWMPVRRDATGLTPDAAARPPIVPAGAGPEGGDGAEGEEGVKVLALDLEPPGPV